MRDPAPCETFSAESSVESLVSWYKKYFDKTRQLLDGNAHHETNIAKNGQILMKSFKLLKQVCDKYDKAKSKGVCGIICIQMTKEAMQLHPKA